jgi:hypothetical protein
MKLKESVQSLDQNDATVKWLSKLIEQDTAMADAPVEAGPDALKSAFRAAIVAVVDDDSLDTKSAAKKITEILKAHDKVAAVGEAAPEAKKDEKASEDEKKSSDASESVDLAAKIAKLEARDKARSLLEDANIKPTDAKHREVMIESLAAVDADKQPALVETWKQPKADNTQAPRSGQSFFRESKAADKDSGKKFASTYLS